MPFMIFNFWELPMFYFVPESDEIIFAYNIAPNVRYWN